MNRTFLIAFLLFGLISNLHADVFRPAYLEIRELGDDSYDVFWKVPVLGDGTRLAAYVQFPPNTETITPARTVEVAGAWTERWQVRHVGGLAGEMVTIEGKALGVTDIIARVERLDGSSQVERLSASRPHFLIKPPLGRFEVAWSYLVLGVEHILGGIDHLLFVLALLLIVQGPKRIILTVTAFTVAHSITLVAATLGWVQVPGPPVEAIIALSIVFVAAEVIHGQRGRPGLTARAPWVVAFSFGLLHGLGFAGALAEVGLPQTAIPVALLTFNVGVEVGQLLFIFTVLSLQALYTRWVSGPFIRETRLASYAIGSVAAFWTIERIAAF